MARITVEDCIEKIPNRFELVMVAAQRARKIGAGAQLTLERDNDKNPVVSLREIAEETVSIDDLKEEIIQNHQKIIENDDEDDSVIDLMEGEEEWASLANKAATEGDAVEPTQEAEEDQKEPSLQELAGFSQEQED